MQRLTRAADGYASRVFNVGDGMINEECNAGAQFIDDAGRFWTGTLGGVTVYNPAWDRPDRQPKPLRLTSITLDGKALDASRITVPPGHHDLRVTFALLSWRQENRSRFRTWLAGFDAHPDAWTTNDTLDIRALPPGRYTLHVEARDYAGNVSKPILLPITVEPEWWQRGWVRALLALLLVLAAYGAFRWRVLALHRHAHELQAQVATRTLELDRANHRLLELAHHDALTALYNRRHFMEVLLHDALDAGRDTALIMLDVDLFKHYNDTWGHPAGDVALRVVANALRSHAPRDATAARYGGEEFVCLLPGHDAAAAALVAERLRQAVASAEVVVPGRPGQVNFITISAGVAARRMASAADGHLLLRDADTAMYRAKAAGRNGVRGVDD